MLNRTNYICYCIFSDDDILTFNHIQDTMAGRFGSSLQSLHNSTLDVIQAAALASDWLNAIKSTPFNQSELLIQAIQDVSDNLSPECKQTLQAFSEDLWSGGKKYPYTLLGISFSCVLFLCPKSIFFFCFYSMYR